MSLFGSSCSSPMLMLEASTKTHCSLLTTHHSLLLLSRVLASSQLWVIGLIRRQMLAHFPTVTQSAGFQPEPLIITLCSLHIAHYSLLTTHCSLLIAHYSLLIAHCSLLTAHYSLLTTHYSLLTAHYSRYGSFSTSAVE